jgi:hypothetical protein
MPHVLSTGGWEAMRWDRWAGLERDNGGWIMEVLDTSTLSPDRVAAGIIDWCGRAVAGEAPALHPADYR